jgi:hypothetical protein
MTGPIISDDPLYQLLRNDDITGFNQARSEGKSCNLLGCDLRGLDLRRLIIKGRC